MVCAMMMPNGLLSYRIMRRKQNSQNYIDIIEKSMIPIININYKDDMIYQQDNAPIHVSKFSKNSFLTKNIKTLLWPANSPDLNPIENVWAVHSSIVYNVGDLKNLTLLQKKIESAMQEFNETRRHVISN